MLLVILLLLSFSSFSSVFAGKTVRLAPRNGGFSLEISEPDGWILDTASAPQIAAAVFYPLGTDWRRSDSRIFIRLAPRQGEADLQQFIQEDREKFEEDCPFADPDENKFSWDEFQGRFEIREYSCPGIRREVAAFSKAEHFFVIIVLSAERSQALETSLPAFREILASFLWQDRPAAQP